MKSFGLEPNPEGTARSPYTIPAVKFPDGVLRDELTDHRDRA